MKEIKEIIGESEFYNAIKSDKPVIVDFGASWCAPCKMQSPIIYELNLNVGDKVDIIKVDVDVNGEIADKYSVKEIPTVAIFNGGELKEKNIGLTGSAKLSEMLIKYL